MNNDYLEHYGVKGMKWGVVNTEELDDLARRTFKGEFGTGDKARRALGENYDRVQARVNELMKSGFKNASKPSASEETKTEEKTNALTTSNPSLAKKPRTDTIMDLSEPQHEVLSSYWDIRKKNVSEAEKNNGEYELPSNINHFLNELKKAGIDISTFSNDELVEMYREVKMTDALNQVRKIEDELSIYNKRFKKEGEIQFSNMDEFLEFMTGKGLYNGENFRREDLERMYECIKSPEKKLPNDGSSNLLEERQKKSRDQKDLTKKNVDPNKSRTKNSDRNSKNKEKNKKPETTPDKSVVKKGLVSLRTK